jgi:hypothetical protein
MKKFDILIKNIVTVNERSDVFVIVGGKNETIFVPTFP